MKKAITILLLVLLLPVSLLAAGAAMPDYYGESYYAELPELYRRLKTTEGKKLVVVGGSNIAFGVDAAQLEQTLDEFGYDYTVCPFGLYAAVGTSVMLELAEDCLREGDVVVLAIEPTAETFSTYFGATAFWKCAESAPELLPALSNAKRSAMAGNYIGYLQERVEITRSDILPRAEGVYAKSSFDETGNMVFDRAGNTMLLGYDSTAPIDLAAVPIEDAFEEQVNNFCALAEQRGTQVVLSFSPMNRGAMAESWEEAVYPWFLRLTETFDCPIISDPNDYIMDSGWFYDNNFHLNTAGAQMRTYNLACDLLGYLGCYREVPFDPPPMPDSIAELPQGEDSTDFLFSPVGEDGYVVSGLTDAGRGRTELIVPSVYEGRPVAGFTAEAFAGNTLLEHLTLPETVAAIPDGAFDGCSRLTRLTLLHTETPPDIGADPFRGANQLTVYVPSNSYSLYRDGAGCEGNPWEHWLGRVTSF